MRITWLGHSAFRIELADAVVLIDPFFTGNPGFDGLDSASATEGVTDIILTHGHGDHLGDTIEIAAETGATVTCNYDLGSWLGHRGVANLELANTGGTVQRNGFTVTFVQAQHSSALVGDDGVAHALGNANGVVIHAPGEKTLYHMGDTDIFGDMALVAELHQPQIGFVPIGDRFTMGGAVAALACRRYFDFETIVPCHYGSFPVVDQTADAFVDAMEGEGERVRAIAPGESIDA